MHVEVRHQRRKSMALKLTPRGAVALIPEHLDAGDPRVAQFIQDALDTLPTPEYREEVIEPDVIEATVVDWADRLHVEVTRIQIRPMRNKWGSISTAGTLTLADDLARLPDDLVEYVIVHELLHLKFPDHRQGWRVTIGAWLPDWQDRDRRLQRHLPE